LRHKGLDFVEGIGRHHKNSKDR